MNDEIMEKLTTDILEILIRWPDEKARLNYKTGASLSYIRTLLLDMGWKNLSSSDFPYLVEKLGFSIERATTKKGFHKSAKVLNI
jgi:hypothetical protein